MHVPGLYLASDPDRGRGVYTAHDLNIGDIIEIAPVVLLPKDQVALINQTILYDYYFEWPDESGRICIAMGYGSFYNHASDSNVKFTFDLDEHTIIFEAIKPIKSMNELYINYVDGERDCPLWFEVK